MTLRVEIQETVTEDFRGFLSVEDDENPNSNVKVAIFDSLGEAQKAIRETIADEGIAAREFVYNVVDDDGKALWTAYYDEVYKHWDYF